MDATTGEVAGASVQIGDPITEKLLIDVLTGADHLWTAITDCGAGGLSSAVGEMAEHIGADVELTAAPLKYPGLAPWEIWLSEAQERMVVAVPPERLAELRARCARHGVELADLGAFTGDGRLVVRHGGDVVARPRHRVPPRRPAAAADDGRRAGARPDAGRAHRRRPDRHAARPARPPQHRLQGDDDPPLRPRDRRRHRRAPAGRRRAATGPATASCSPIPRDTHGIAIGIGVDPWFGLHDPEAMAHAVVDEAIRNVVAVGADPDRVALLDNFSWGDPRRPSTLGELVAAVRGCHDAAIAYGAPFVSGKDSLNNEYTGADGQRHAVPPTLVITAVAHVPDVGRCVTAELTAPGNVAAAARSAPTPSSPAATSTSCSGRPRRASAPRRSPIPTPRPATAGCTGDPRRARAVVPRRQRGRPRRRPRRAVHRRRPRRGDRRAPPRRPGHRPVRRVDRPPRRRGPPRRRRHASSPSPARPPCSARSAPSPFLSLPGLPAVPVAPSRRRSTGADA